MAMIELPDFTATPLAELLSLAGQSAVVTGGAKGIGAAVVARLAEAGANVVVADLDLDEGKATAERVAAATGAQVVATTVDVADSASLVAAAELAVGVFGRLDIWVNNAGIYPATGAIEAATDERFARILEVNVSGSFAGAREAARRMTGGGVIINLASAASFKAIRGLTGYVTSKHAVIGLTRNLALELAPAGIRVLAVAPGQVLTPGVEAALEKIKAAGTDLSGAPLPPLGRIAVPDDVARVVLFCASPLSAYMTGATVTVDAGNNL